LQKNNKYKLLTTQHNTVAMMSGQVITELFQQIVHSEERIKQRFEDLKKGIDCIGLVLVWIPY